MNDTPQTAAAQPVATEIDVGTAAPPPSPMRKVILIALALLLILFVYHVLSDRFTPYTSQARVEAFLTQVAPEVAGDVREVGVKDNGLVRKGQLLFRIDPEPYELAVRSAEANLSVALQAADVSVADVAAARAQIIKQRADLSASRQLGGIVTGLVGKRALPETQGIRAHADTAKSEADLTRAQADLRKAQANLGAPGLRNPKVRQALAALDQARLDLRNTEVRAPADGTVTNLATGARAICHPGPAAAELPRRRTAVDFGGHAREPARQREARAGRDRRARHQAGQAVPRPGPQHRLGRQPGRRSADRTIVVRCRQTRAGCAILSASRCGSLVLPDEAKEAGIDVGRSGAQANVIIFTEITSILNPIGRLWIKVIALLSYLQ